MRWFSSAVTVTEILLTDPRFDEEYCPEQASHAKTVVGHHRPKFVKVMKTQAERQCHQLCFVFKS